MQAAERVNADAGRPTSTKLSQAPDTKIDVGDCPARDIVGEQAVPSGGDPQQTMMTHVGNEQGPLLAHF